MKTIFSLVTVWALSFSLNNDGGNAFMLDPYDAPIKNEKLIIYPNPATTEINIELNDASFAEGIINIKDLAGRKYVVLPVKGREDFLIHLDRRFVPGNYVVDVVKGKSKVSGSFSVME